MQYRIIRIYGAAGHGKGMVDAMSSYGVKSILHWNIIGTLLPIITHRNIITHYYTLFQSSSEICVYLQFREHQRECSWLQKNK